MPDIFIDWVNLLGKYQPEILVFSDRKFQLIGDGDVKITGVDGDENIAALLKNDNENDNIDNQEDQEDAYTKQ